MAGKSKFEQLKERFAQQARARIPFNPLDSKDITGANVDRLKAGMETFGWKDYRFVTADQARANGWTIAGKASSVRIQERDASNGSMSEKVLFNASNVRGMPSLEAMLAMSEEAMLKMRGEETEVAASVGTPAGVAQDVPSTDAGGSDVEDDIVIGPARVHEQQVAASLDAHSQDAKDLAQGESGADLDNSVKESGTPVVAGQPNLDQAAEPAVETDFAVMAPYWLDGLHNHEGIEMAEQINRLIAAEKLARNKAAIATLLHSYPDNRRFGLDIVPQSKYLNDPHRKANLAEPAHLLGGELIRDKEGAYRPKAGGMAVLQDKGSSLLLKNKSEEAYRGAMELALAKGWKAIELKGKPKMLAQAWLEAKMMGLEVVNFTPTEQDREKLAQRMAEEVRKREAAAARAEALAPENVEVRPVVDANGKQVMATVTYTVERTDTPAEELASSNGALSNALAAEPFEEPVVTRTVTRVEGVVRDDVVAGVAMAHAPEQGRQLQPEAVASVVDHEVNTALGEVKREQSALVDLEKGAKLVAHGPAPYDHNPKNKASYFVTVENDSGQSRTVWGVDLPRSLSAAGAEPGDTISLVEGGREPVEVEVEEPDGSKSFKMTHRVNWTTAVLSRAAEVAPAAEVASSGMFIGPVVRVEEGRIAQKAGRDPNKLIWHDVSKLQGKVPAVGEIAEINYAHGVGKIKEQALGQELGR
ncbi:MAG: LPD7 domain-containing protein [bacterium]|jgi:hypothetical protein